MREVKANLLREGGRWLEEDNGREVGGKRFVGETTAHFHDGWLLARDDGWLWRGIDLVLDVIVQQA